MKQSLKLILLVCIAIGAIQTAQTSSAAQKPKRRRFVSEEHGEKVNILSRRLLDDGASDAKGTKEEKKEKADKDDDDDKENKDDKKEGDDDDDEDGDGKKKQPLYCNNELLYSYGVLNSGLREEKSKLCGDVEKNTCCSPTSEQVILNLWKNNNRARIKMYIEGYVYLFKAILNFYEDYIEKANKIRQFPSAPPECKAAAERMIEKFRTPDQNVQFVPQLEKAYQHMGFARKSFYCTLCSTDAQPYFDTINKNIIFAKQFCENFVRSTISEFHERSVEYMDIFNQMNIIADCDPNAPYEPDVYAINMRMDDASESVISKCHASFVKDSDFRVFFEECTDYCSTFSMTHAREMVEGNFTKLYFLYQKIVAMGSVPSKLIYDEIDYAVKYDFGYIGNEFYESNLKTFELDSYTSSFERNGIELFYIAANSDLGYSKKDVAKMSVVGILVALLTWVIGK